MSLPIRLTRRSLSDRSRLVSFLRAVSPSAAIAALNVIDEALDDIADYPRAGTDLGLGVREWIVRFGQGGYAIRYRSDADAVIITRIFHTREKR